MRLSWLVVATLFFGCPDYRPPPPVDDDGGVNGVPEWADGVFELGAFDLSGEWGFVEFPTEAILVSGAQGGFHVPVVYRITGKTLAKAHFEHRVRRASDGVLLSRGSRDFEVGSDAGPWFSSQVTVFLCPTPVGINLENETVTFEVTVTRPTGELLSIARKQTILRCAGSVCQSVCKG